MQRIITFKADSSQSGHTLKQIMKRKYKFSNGLITQLKQREGSILVDGKPQFVNFKVSTGEIVTLTIEDSELRHSKVASTPHPVDIVFEDKDILIVNKPPFLPCHPVTGNQENTLSNFLVSHYAEHGLVFVPRVITRLDSNTSGLVLFAKNALSAEILNTMSAKHEIEKKYTAITVGTPSHERGEIRKHIRRCENSAIKHEVCTSDDGKDAVTLYTVCQTYNKHNLAVLEVQTLTGRTHQIRVHLASIGCPLVGDFLYGAEAPELIPRHALHAHELKFIHPLTGKKMSFSAPLPKDMLELLQK